MSDPINELINEVIDLKTTQVGLLSASLFTLKVTAILTLVFFLFVLFLSVASIACEGRVNDLAALTECSSVLLN